MKKNKLRCIAPTVGKNIYKYHSGSLGEQEAKKFLDHASTCAKCEKTLRRLGLISETLKKNPAEFFTPEELGWTHTGRWQVRSREIKMFVELSAMKLQWKLKSRRQGGKLDPSETAADIANFVSRHRHTIRGEKFK